MSYKKRVTSTPALLADNALKLQTALALHQQGQIAQAQAIYEEILESEPNHIDALQLLATAALQRNDFEGAVLLFIDALKINPSNPNSLHNYGVTLYELKQYEDALLNYDKAIAFSPHFAQAYYNRGNVYKELKRFEVALLDYSKAIELNPDYFEAHLNLGNVLQELNRQCEALECYERVIVLRPDYAEAYSNRGNALLALKRYEEAIILYDKALALKFDFAEVYSNRGVALYKLKRYQESIISYDKAISLKPDYADAYLNKGNVLEQLNRYEEALLSYGQATVLIPDSPDAYNNSGNVLAMLCRYEESIKNYEKAIYLKPDFAEAYSNRGNVLQDLSHSAEAENSYRNALKLKPDYSDAYNNLLCTLNYTFHDVANNLQDALNYGKMASEKVDYTYSSWECKARPKRLRVGFVSGDFRNHAVSYFLDIIIKQLDPSIIELVAYSTEDKNDELTERIKPYFSAWRPLLGVEDKQAAQLIHQDGIHILIDLAGHTAKNRLPVFAWKPAPIQVSWLGYSATTGLTAMDYYLGDPYVSPVEEEWHFTEKIWRLPESYLCYTPPAELIVIKPLPALGTGHVTFCCFNNLLKVNDTVIALWSRVLHAVPRSVLFLRTKQLTNESIQENIIRQFAIHGIARERLILEGSYVTRKELFEEYNRVDISLDPFPYTGTTTSAEGLWMGVPVLTRKGDRFLSHVGESIAHNSGLVDWIAEDDDDYVAKAIMHTANLERLATLRSGLRAQVLASPLFDAPRFARHFEEALWGMWKQYSEKNTHTVEPMRKKLLTKKLKPLKK